MLPWLEIAIGVDLSDIATAVGDIREALIYLLLHDATVAGLVGSNISPYWSDQAEESPRITVSITGGGRQHNISGANGMSYQQFAVDIFAASKRDAVAVRKAVDVVFDGYSGVVNGLSIAWIGQEDESDTDVYPNAGTGQFIAWISVDYTVKYRTAIAA